MPSHLILDCDGTLEPFEYEHLEAYFQLVLRKIERGRPEYGMDYLKRSDESYREQIDEELADCIGWPAMQYVKNHMKDVVKLAPDSIKRSFLPRRHHIRNP